MSKVARERKRPGPEQIQLPLALQERLPELRRQVTSISIPFQRPTPEQSAQINDRKWQIGRVLLETLGDDASGRRTALSEALGRELGCKGSLVRGLITVAREFPGPLPRQYWETLLYLARIEDLGRRQSALLLLPDWAPIRQVRPTKEEALAQRMLREIKLNTQQEFDAARHFISKLGANEQLFIATTILRSFDQNSVAELIHPDRKLEELLFVVENLRSLLVDAAVPAAHAAESHEQTSG